ncbi:MAG: hypothetical protein PVJ39_04100 [Gammaproteobacteria bacterium]|jgi:hypothetical protein
MANNNNNSGYIVDVSQNSGVIWRDGEVYNLNELLDAPLSAHIDRAIDMNRQGRILVAANDGFFCVLVPTEEIQQ